MERCAKTSGWNEELFLKYFKWNLMLCWLKSHTKTDKITTRVIIRKKHYHSWGQDCVTGSFSIVPPTIQISSSPDTPAAVFNFNTRKTRCELDTTKESRCTHLSLLRNISHGKSLTTACICRAKRFLFFLLYMILQWVMQSDYPLRFWPLFCGRLRVRSLFVWWVIYILSQSCIAADVY